MDRSVRSQVPASAAVYASVSERQRPTSGDYGSGSAADGASYGRSRGYVGRGVQKAGKTDCAFTATARARGARRAGDGRDSPGQLLVPVIIAQLRNFELKAALVPI